MLLDAVGSEPDQCLGDGAVPDRAPPALELLGIEARRQGGETGDVDEEHGDVAALPLGQSKALPDRLRRWGLDSQPLGDGGEKGEDRAEQLSIEDWG
ncbi:MAG: hypothetical protein ACRD0U_01080, partial [Acidimicrobiales bacterium]